MTHCGKIPLFAHRTDCGVGENREATLHSRKILRIGESIRFGKIAAQLKADKDNGSIPLVWLMLIHTHLAQGITLIKVLDKCR
jgi:hypothetical protein